MPRVLRAPGGVGRDGCQTLELHGEREGLRHHQKKQSGHHRIKVGRLKASIFFGVELTLDEKADFKNWLNTMDPLLIAAMKQK